MARKVKKCFLISPIGDEGTEIREEADALLWIAKSALESYGFAVVRVDQLARTAVITNEIVQLIQEAELCLIVLTHENPNVFYEAGRRHETGKPFIQLIKRGERIPFDVAGIKTIIYGDVEARTAVAKTIEDIRQFVDEYEKTGYGATGSGVSLSTVSATLDRIERKVGQILGQSPASGIASGLPGGGLRERTEEGQVAIAGFRSLAEAFKDPREAVMEALFNGNIDQVAAMLPRLEKAMKPLEFIGVAGIAAAARVEPAVEVLLRLLPEHLDELLDSPDDRKRVIVTHAIGSVATFYHGSDREAEGYARLAPVIEVAVSRDGLPAETKASLKNQLQRLLYGMGKYEQAMEFAEEVIELDPRESSYYFNASLIYEKLGLVQKAASMVDKFMELGTRDDDHLHQAVEVYVRTQQLEKAHEALKALRKISPFKGIMFDDEIRQALGINLGGYSS